ncbi:hypothetical protein M0804_004410 [Polistes exclamans]|nr:hypothetical protein M0804_004410 [Polistes exclamans]
MAACYLSYPGVHTSSTQKIHGVALIARFRESGVTLNEFKHNTTKEINNLSPKVLSEVMTNAVKEYKLVNAWKMVI